MKSIGLWDISCPEKVFDTILIHEDEYDCYKLSVDDGITNKNCILAEYLLRPNGRENHHYFLYYILYKFYDDGGYEIESSDNKIKVFFEIWEHFVKAFNYVDVHLSAEMLRLLDEYKPDFFKKATFFIENISIYLEDVLYPYINGNIYHLSKDESRLWWKYQPQIINDFKGCADKLNKADIIKHNIFFQIHKQVQQLYDTFNQLRVGNIEDAFYKISAYCYFLSNNANRRNNNLLALTLAYRTIDIYYQYHAIKEDIIIPSKRELEYSTTYKIDKSRQMITLANSEYHLTQSNIFSIDSNRTGFTDRLSNLRNKCLLAHNVCSATDFEVSDVITKSANLIKGIETNNRWKQLSESFEPKVVITNDVIFQMEEGIESFIQKI